MKDMCAAIGRGFYGIGIPDVPETVFDREVFEEKGIRIRTVERADGEPFADQRGGEMRSDETGSAGDEDAAHTLQELCRVFCKVC
jgi:hypothetical protein